MIIGITRIDKYVEKFHPDYAEREQDTKGSLSIEDELEAELAEMKTRNKVRTLTSMLTKIPGLVFMRLEAPVEDPTVFVEAICQDLKDTATQKSRYVPWVFKCP